MWMATLSPRDTGNDDVNRNEDSLINLILTPHYSLCSQQQSVPVNALKGLVEKVIIIDDVEG